MGTLDSLYPPVINTYMPAFVVKESEGKYTGSIRVYFSISKYNSSEIKQVWVTVNDQHTNKNLVKKDNENKTGLLLKSLSRDLYKTGDDKYYVDINQKDLSNSSWEVNKTYKIQIRFSNINGEIENTDSFIVKNQDYFSEWSTVCLLYPILEPELKLNNFDEENLNSETTFSSMNLAVVGKIVFKDKESLESYRIKIFKRNSQNADFDSGDIFSSNFNSNEINYTPKYGFLEGEHYKLEVSYITKNLYESKKNFYFMIMNPVGERLKADLYITPENDLGRIKVNLKSNEEYYVGNITIRRTSNKSDFLIWEDVYTFSIDSSGFFDYVWYDYSVESGVWYKYCAQKRHKNGDRSLIVKGYEEEEENFSIMSQQDVNKKKKKKEQSMIVLNDIFLSGENGKHLKIKFNPQISSFSHTLSESSTQTIGSKYPFINRNAEVNYKQFPISGLISYHMDEDNLFTNKNILLNNSVELYDEYNKKQNISQYKDFILEKAFREEVKDFLYDGKVKLFRSATEGNILIRLMNISLTPKAELGRMIYSFNATAYEIDNLTIENLDKYNIQKIGELKETVFSEYEVFKQNIFSQQDLQTDVDNWIDIYNLIQDKEEKMFTGNTQKIVKNLKNLVLNIEGEPYLITVDESNNLIPVTEERNYSSNCFFGYLLNIKTDKNTAAENNNYFYIKNTGLKEGILSLDNDLNITQLKLYTLKDRGNPKINKISVQATLTINEKEKENTIPEKTRIYEKIDQIKEDLKQDTDIVDLIMKKHSYSNGVDYQKLLLINSLKIEADPYSIFSLRDSSDLKERLITIGSTGILNLEEKEFVLQKLRYVGRTILDSKNYTNEKGQEVKFKSEEDIQDPQEKMIYIIEDSEGQQLFKKIIYLNGSFQLFDDKIKGVLINSSDLAHVSITYTFLLEKGNYRSIIAEEENG